MTVDPKPQPDEIPQLEAQRGLLEILAQSALSKKLRRKLDPEDLVQEVMVRAYRAFEKFENPNDAYKVKAWLLTIMANVLKDILKHFSTDKRDISHEYSAAVDLFRSAAGLEAFLAAEQTSPSQAAVRNEEQRRLAIGLKLLPEDVREVVIGKHLHNQTLQEIADRTGRTTASVAGLLRRGLARLRDHLA